jgi:predicted TPR repeat methyltransferase
MAKPLDTSSGDILADRRADYAEMLFGSGEAAPAAELMLGALELAPGWAMGWFRLGEFHEAAGDMEAAVEALFDQYAEKFDHALVETLGYRVPEFLAEAIAKTGTGRFRLALDLGCGTGLMGERLRPVCDRLEGFDISAEMLRKARAKGVYDRLEKADLQAFSHDGPKADLVTAADVFMYVGALEGVVKTVAALLAEDGLFAFSVEKLDAADGFELQLSRRYAHAEEYVQRVLREAGLAVVSLEKRIIRQDRNEPVNGLIVTARPL